MKKKKICKIQDMNYASVLVFKNFKLINVEWEGTRACWMFEENQPSVNDVIRSYINGQLKGEIKKFVNSQSIIKQTLFSKQ